MQIVIDIDKDVFERIKSGIPESIDCFKCEEAVLYGTPQPKTGQWIPQEMETYIDGKLKHWKAYKCNKCNNLLTDDYEYCPNCGAKMHLLIEEMTGDEWVDDVVESMKGETWNGIHAQITAPKGTFERIFNDADDENDI